MLQGDMGGGVGGGVQCYCYKVLQSGWVGKIWPLCNAVMRCPVCSHDLWTKPKNIGGIHIL